MGKKNNNKNYTLHLHLEARCIFNIIGMRNIGKHHMTKYSTINIIPDIHTTLCAILKQSLAVLCICNFENNKLPSVS